MRQILKGEFQNIRTLPGYRNISHICSEIYEEFKQKCAEGNRERLPIFTVSMALHGSRCMVISSETNLK